MYIMRFRTTFIMHLMYIRLMNYFLVLKVIIILLLTVSLFSSILL